MLKNWKSQTNGQEQYIRAYFLREDMSGSQHEWRRPPYVVG